MLNKRIYTFPNFVINSLNEFLTYNELITKFGNVLTFIEYYGIISAIPRTWKQIFVNNIPTHEQNRLTFYEMFQNKIRSTSGIYNYIIESPYLVNDNKVKWEIILQKPMDNKFFCTLFERIKYITLCGKLRSFQYRLLNHAILTNKRLFKMKQVDTEKCTFCELETETITHHLWECQTAQHIWQNVKDWFMQKTGRDVSFTVENIIFNNITKNPIDCINIVCLITKQYLYSSRCLKEIPNFYKLKQKIIETHNIEKYIATSMGKLTKHEKKWENFT